jgi:uncharacterized protein YjbI with pentapeptide repeats
MSPEHKRLTYALLLSLLIHTLLLSLAFGAWRLWLPGLGFPWDRRIEAPDLRVVIVPAQVTAAEPAVTPFAEPLQQARVEQPVASGPAVTPSVSRAATPLRSAGAIAPGANPRADAATGAVPAQPPSRADRPGDTAPPPIPAPAVIALERIDQPTWVLPAIPAMQTPVMPPAPGISGPETAKPSLPDAGEAARARIDQEALPPPVELARLGSSNQAGQRQAEQLEAVQREAARQMADLREAARQEAARTEAAQQEFAQVEAARIEAARVEAARVEAAQVEAARVKAAQVEAAQVEAARAKAAEVEAARIEAARIEAARVEAAQVEAARVKAAEVEAARIEAARVEAQEAEARREARLRAIGRQLDEEADQREAAMAAARQSPSLPQPSWTPARRYRLFGRTDPNQDIILYAEAWERKIQLNMTLDMVREAAKQPHTDPLVTVAIRSDGSVESVTMVQSSGVAAIDEAIRRIVDSQKPYQAFPPGLARAYDVIEIRRTWYFDKAIRLY